MTVGGGAGFSVLVGRWFAGRFGTPTDVQAAGWPEIAAGRDVLLAAPTGSGKTLAAFLWSIDQLLRRAAAGALEDRTYVVYVSPLKALGNDVQKNLRAPLAELQALAADTGEPCPPLRVLVRSGDTPAHERQQMTRRPPHVLITTPESLYILLTAEKSRRFLAGAETVIVDEIHAVAQDKRGAHLALSLERLDDVAGRPLQRIGLSATQRPLERVGRLLCGAGRPLPSMVDVGHRRHLDLSVETLDLPLGPVTTHEYWALLYQRLEELIAAHRTTIVFVHTRRLVERVAHALEERLGRGRVAAHHGSMARRIRLEAEEKLKSGEVPVVVATGSLELGIDVGTVDLVCHLGAPRALATLIQRVGRSGHARGATPKGILFPLTRDDLVQAAALVRGVRAGELDELVVPRGPRDVLAQQLVAHVAAAPCDVEALLDLVRRAWPYRDVGRADLEPLLEMLSEGVATRRGRRGAHVHWDRVHDRVRGRRGARLAAITSGGAIPDTADYDVVEEPAGLHVGRVNEDFAVESMRGDIFLLGNRSWRILRVEANVMRVEDAHGLPPTVPFWTGEAPGRTRELSEHVAALRQAVVAHGEAPPAWLEAECALSPDGAVQLASYVRDGVQALGAVPGTACIVAERFFDEAGGMQLVLHAPFGARINRALGLALRKRFCVGFDFELQAAATDDGIVLSLGAQHSFPLDGIFALALRDGIAEDLTQAALQSPMFANRWRWNATRALALLRHEAGARVPVALQRMRAEDLLAAVFPAQLGCQDNRPAGPLPIPDHPLVQETVDDCLHEAMDLDGLVALQVALARGDVARHAIDTVAPSPFSHEILHSNPYSYLDDAPLEERRARAVTLRQSVPALAGGLGALDAGAIAEVTRQAWPPARDADELHDVLLSLGVLPRPACARAGWLALADALLADARATWVRLAAADGEPLLVAAERLARVRRALPGVTAESALREPPERQAEGEEDALAAIVGGWLACSGPTTVRGLAEAMGIPASRVAIGLAQLEQVGVAMRGRYRAGAADEEWCERGLLARIHRLTLGTLRREIEPVPMADFMRFLFRWQHLQPGTRLHGRHGVLEVVGQLQGFELPARAWEHDILPARISRYEPDELEALCLGGLVAWGRLRPAAAVADGDEAPVRPRAPGRAAPLTFVLRDDLPWLLGPTVPVDDLPPAAAAVLDALVRRGASFAGDLARATGLAPAQVDEALWALVARGIVTGDGVAGLRLLIDGDEQGRRLRAVVPGRARVVPAGRWALLRDDVAGEAAGVDVERWARLLLRRWGVVLRELLKRETGVPPWRELVRELRRLEARGEVRGGRFVAGTVGEQFALPEAVEALRGVRRTHAAGEMVTVAAADPLNLVGILVPGARVPPAAHATISWRDGVPVAVDGGELDGVAPPAADVV